MKIQEADQMMVILQTMLQAKGIVGFKIARNLRMIEEELKEFNKIKGELFQKYGESKGDNLIIEKDTENFTKYNEDIKPYLEQEVNFDFKKITDDEFMNSDLTAEQIYILSNYFGE